ncbi:MAG: amidohydrolase family protein, partial [Pseudonocardia sp.]|nr:amidohydrolase family protein [Pseudonocardia sp.]
VTRRMAAAYGPERLLWASDHPWPSRVPGYGVLPSLVDAALPDLDQAGRARVLGDTACALFPQLRRGGVAISPRSPRPRSE